MAIWGMFILWGGWGSFGTNIGYVNIVGGRGLVQSLGMLIFGGPCGGLGQISGMLILWGQGKGRVGGQMLILGGGGFGTETGMSILWGWGVLGQTLGMLIL